MILILVPLAGCSGTDTEVKVDLSNEEINDLIDENLEDVMNNTTVVVFQEYNNNTTHVVDQSGTSSTNTYYFNGSSNGSSQIFVSRITWAMQDILPNFTSQINNIFSFTFSYYDYATNDDRNDTFTRPCSEFYDIPLGYLPNDWDDDYDSTNRSIWGNSQYGAGDMSDFYRNYWDDKYNNTIRDMLEEARYHSNVVEVCETSNLLVNEEYYQGSTYVGWNSSSNRDEYVQHDRRDERYIFHQIELEEGISIRVIQVNMVHAFTYHAESWSSPEIYNGFNWYVVDELGERSGNAMMSGYYGGWQDLTLRFAYHDNVWMDSEFEMIIYYELIPVTNV